MKQHAVIEFIKTNAASFLNVEVAMLIGSFARNEASVNSDIDIAMIVSEDFNPDDLKNIFIKYSGSEVLKCHNVSLKNKMVTYFKDIPKLELLFYKTFEELKRNFIGSETPMNLIKDSILFDKKSDAERKLIELHNTHTLRYEEEKTDLIDKFIYEFELASNAHKRSDAFHFYFFYNCAFHCYIRLLQISRGDNRFNFLPRKVTSDVLKNEEERQQFYKLASSLYLPEANKKKRALLEAFYVVLNDLEYADLKATKDFCEYVFERDYLWNFRDAGEFNPNIKKGKIYRTSTLTNYQNDEFFKDFLKNRKITRVVDLRADRELSEMPYKKSTLDLFEYVHAPFDPWNQSIEFKANYNYGTNVEIAYRFFVIECKPYIKRTFETLLSNTETATAIHCFAGKDRTGFIMILIGLLLETPTEFLLQDYMASEMDMKKEHFDIYINNIHEQGGIVKFLISCGLTEMQIENFIKNFKNE